MFLKIHLLKYFPVLRKRIAVFFVTHGIKLNKKSLPKDKDFTINYNS
jgi:hypothetical protein